MKVREEKKCTSEGGAERQRERERERKRERIPSRLCTVSSEPNTWLELTNHKIMT